MSAAAKLLARKQALLEGLESDPGPNEREESQALLAQMKQSSCRGFGTLPSFAGSRRPHPAARRFP